MTTTFLKSRFLRTNSTTNSALRGLIVGVAAGVVLCVVARLSPFAAADRSPLALLCVTLSLPFGAIMARRADTMRDAGGVGLGAVVGVLSLASIATLLEPALWLRTSSWCVAAALVGVSIGSLSRTAGVAATCLWLFLNGLPFFYDRLPIGSDTAETWALQACPWLGFSQDAFGGDPLRRPVLYMGHWTSLSGAGSFSVLGVATIWLAAVPGFASLLILSGIGGNHDATEDSPELERAGA